jgi:hypothetical protein
MDASAKALLDENAVLKAQLAVALAKASEDMALIAAQKLQIAKLSIGIELEPRIGAEKGPLHDARFAAIGATEGGRSPSGVAPIAARVSWT